MRSEVCVPDIIVPVVGGKTQYGRESNETKDGWNSFQNSEDMDVEDTKNVIVKNTCFSHSDLIIPETYRGCRVDTTAGKDSLDKSTCYTGSVNTRISSSLKSSQAEKDTLEVNDIQVILPERDQWIDQERIDSMKRFVGKLPFNLSPDITKTSENSLIEKKLIRNFHELLLPKVKSEVKSMTERCKTMQSTPVKRELLTMNEDSCIFLKVFFS